MPSLTRTLAFSALMAFVNSQAVIQKAVGDRGESLPLQVDISNPADNNFIADAEIRENIVNACGRTANGNIDIGESSEINLSKNAVTSVKKGGKLVLTIKQVNDQGAGPFDCDLDLTNNADGLTGQTKLQTTENKRGDNIEVTATLPNNMKCIGGSTGDLCMVRCRNRQNFGGCVAIQQTDTTANQNTPANIKTGGSLKAVLDQITQNQRDFKVAVDATAKATEKDQGKDVALALVAADTANGVLRDQNTTRVSAPAGKNNNNGKKNNNNNNGKKNNAKKNNNGKKNNAKKNNNGKKNNAKKNNNGKARKNNGKKANANARKNNGKKANANARKNNGKKANANARKNNGKNKNNRRATLWEQVKREEAHQVEEVQVNAQNAVAQFDDEE